MSIMSQEESTSVARLAALAMDVGPVLARESMLEWPIKALSPMHRQVLSQLNGFTLNDGSIRILGLRSEPHLDLAVWNATETWRFAWGDLSDQFFVIGETGWGDQYALRRIPGTLDFYDEIVELDANTLNPRVICSSADAFFGDYLLRNAHQPFDFMTTQAINRLGRLPAAEHWVLAPPIVLGASEDIANLVVLDARASMIYAGDIYLALQASAPGSRPQAIIPYIDEAGRPRLRVDFD